ncbi:uncharacterized protein FTOL_07680 [Fusarium torulosum]|uniref:Aminoglycoside phosphotransferase domain-containing protein n=1 Tax=Fusarium torulosum TaxID=33205 RepID=A0AAE8MB81_9HYPO|nr:uncharacterized protein FTOL_07680 [Fusarium torulosum]
MADEQSPTEKALEVITNSSLEYPDDQILECFIENSIDPDDAACYLLKRCTRNDGFEVASLLSDWKQLVSIFADNPTTVQPKPDKATMIAVERRDGGKCCITGLEGSLMDPLVVRPIVTVPKTLNKSLSELLDYFIGPETHRQMMEDPALIAGFQNHWLVRESTAVALSQGYFQFDFLEDYTYHAAQVSIGGPLYPSILEKVDVVRPGRFMDHSGSDLPLPNIGFLETISRFSPSIRWLLVGQEIAVKSQRPAYFIPPLYLLYHRLSEYAAVTLITICRLMPSSLRIPVYRFLGVMGGLIYGDSSSFKVQRLPFGMYLKTGRVQNFKGLANEYGALQLLRKSTHVPVPRPLDLTSSGDTCYMLSTQLPGHCLGQCIDSLTECEIKTLVQDLQNCLNEMRALPNEAAPKHAICNAIGGPCYDFRIVLSMDYDEERGDFVGPFVNEDEFNAILQTPALPGVAHHDGHKIVFTHSDLNMRNILMYNGRLAGIVDWENSGWYPDYWEYTKARFITKWNKRFLGMVETVFETLGDYKSELATEQQLWEYCM